MATIQLPLNWFAVGYDYSDVQDEGIKAGEIIAWRCWRVVNGLLRSMVVDVGWPPGEPLTARGGMHDFGIHAWSNLHIATFYTVSSCLMYPNVVFGSVAMWGEVVEHVSGYRAEHARVNSIDSLFGGQYDIDKLRSTYLGLTR